MTTSASAPIPAPAPTLALDKFTVAQIATALSTLTGETITAKSFNYKGKAVDRLTRLIAEQGLSDHAVLQAAGIEALTPDGTALSGIGLAQPAVPASPATPDKPKRITKQSLLIERLKQPGGASLEELATEFQWRHHTVRGAIAGALKKKLGLTITSVKDDTRGLVYSLKAED